MNRLPRKVFLLLLFTVAVSIAIAKGTAIGIILLLVLPGLLFFTILLLSPNLIWGLLITMSFMVALLGRYLPSIPFGLSIDFLLVIAAIALIFNRNTKLHPDFFSNPASVALIIWLLFSFFQIFNPESQSTEAWFYANRGLSFYPLLVFILSLHAFNTPKHLRYFLIFWGFLAFFGSLWGLKQLFFGVSATEQQWLNNGAASTHVLFGKLRIFSFFSDAPQFGANQAHTALVFGLLGIFGKSIKSRWVFIVLALITFYGMVISGTRGVLAILAIGGLVYLVLNKNFKIAAVGLFVAFAFFGFLKYTSIGQSNYQINRMRTALDPNDPSLLVRKDRINILGQYLESKPMGGGIGSAGFWGKRFSPGSYLAEIGTDGHYTRVWMETGIIGLYLYLAMLVSILFYLGSLLWRMEPSYQRDIAIAFFSGFAGVVAASYTNGLLTQLPTGPIAFMSIAFVYLLAKNKLTANVST